MIPKIHTIVAATLLAVASGTTLSDIEPQLLGTQQYTQLNSIEDLDIRQYTKKEHESLEATGKKFLIVVGADWCRYCRSNMKKVNTPEVLQLLSDNDIIILYADLSKANKDASDFLRSKKQNTIPYYLAFDGKNYNELPISFSRKRLLSILRESLEIDDRITEETITLHPNQTEKAE